LTRLAQAEFATCDNQRKREATQMLKADLPSMRRNVTHPALFSDQNAAAWREAVSSSRPDLMPTGVWMLSWLEWIPKKISFVGFLLMLPSEFDDIYAKNTMINAGGWQSKMMLQPERGD